MLCGACMAALPSFSSAKSSGGICICIARKRRKHQEIKPIKMEDWRKQVLEKRRKKINPWNGIIGME